MKQNGKIVNLVLLVIFTLIFNRMLKKKNKENKKISGLEIVLTAILFLLGNKKKD
ncbi:MAG: hypothetical protein IKE28_07590 [Solobacterium sp.]|nr:hypothetical protein [Solobacterium sp.]